MVQNLKKYIIVTTVLFISSFFLDAQSQYAGELAVSLGAGSSAIKYTIEQEHSKPGFGGELGLGYTYYFNKTMGFSLGLEAERFAGSIAMKTFSFDQQIQTPPGLSGRFLLQARYDDFKEKQTALLLQIPVMLQFQFPVNEKNFFFLGTGIKAGFPVSSKWNQNIGSLTTTGYSDYTGQQYENMPSHGFSTFSSINASGKLELKNLVLLAFEGGLKFAVAEGKILYTGVFFDYSLNDMYKAADKTALLEYNNASPADYLHKSILTSNLYTNAEGIKPFAVGIKIKIGIGIRGKAHKSVKQNIRPKEQKTESIGD